MGILLALALVLPLTTIFLFKRRMLQFRLGVVEMILLLGAQIVMGIYYFLSYRLFSSFEFHAQSVKLPLLPIFILPQLFRCSFGIKIEIFPLIFIFNRCHRARSFLRIVKECHPTRK